MFTSQFSTGKPLKRLCCSCALSACSKESSSLPCSKKTDVMRRVVAARQAAGEQDLSITDARLAELQQRSRNSRGITASAVSPAQVRASYQGVLAAGTTPMVCPYPTEVMLQAWCLLCQQRQAFPSRSLQRHCLCSLTQSSQTLIELCQPIGHPMGMPPTDLIPAPAVYLVSYYLDSSLKHDTKQQGLLHSLSTG